MAQDKFVFIACKGKRYFGPWVIFCWRILIQSGVLSYMPRIDPMKLIEPFASAGGLFYFDLKNNRGLKLGREIDLQL